MYYGLARRIEPAWHPDEESDAEVRRADLDLTSRVLLDGIRGNYLKVNASWMDASSIWGEVMQPLHRGRGRDQRRRARAGQEVTHEERSVDSGQPKSFSTRS